MYLTKTKTKSDIIYYVCKGVREGKKVKSVKVSKIGNHSQLLLQHSDPETYARSVIEKMNKEYEERKHQFVVKIDSTKLKKTDQKISKSDIYNVGYIYLTKIFENLKFDDFFEKITQKSKLKYNPTEVLKYLTASRIINPHSKNQTYQDIKQLYGNHNIKLEDIYKTMDLINENLLGFQKSLYKNSTKITDRNTSVLYYDCTNFFFETKQEDSLRKYGKSKENRSKPIVQLGLFMDRDGLPLAFKVFAGNENETKSVKPLEKTIVSDFELSNFIYCADAGLNSNDIRLYNSFQNRNYLVTQSLKKLKRSDQDLILTDDNWQSLKTGRLHSISTISEDDRDIYYKVMIIDNPIDVGLREYGKNGQIKKKTSFKQRLIVTYRKQYELAQRQTRASQIDRAINILDKKTYDVQHQTSPKRLLRSNLKREYELDFDKIEDEERFDGYYASVTSLDSEVSEILKIISKRWEIEESFKIMKTNLKARPVFHYKPERIVSHFTICFTSLLIYRILENLLDNKYSVNEIIKQLQNMEVSSLNDVVYKTHYSHSEILEDLENIFELGLDRSAFLNTDLNKTTFKNNNKLKKIKKQQK